MELIHGCALSAAALVVVYLFYRWIVATHDYFKKRNVPAPKPYPVFGGLWPMFAGKMHAIDAASEGYRLFPDARFSGFWTFRNPGYLIHDPALVKQIAIKDFDHFTDHGNNVSPEVDPILGRSLFFMSGQRWKHGRSALSPAFTGSKMKNMFSLVSNYVENAMLKLVNDANGEKMEKEMKDLFQRLGSDVTTSISFGVETDSIHNPDNDFFINGKKMTTTSGFQGLKFLLMSLLPATCFTTFGFQITPRSVTEFFVNIVSKTIENRERNNIKRPDFIHLLTLARKNELKTDAISDTPLESAGFSTVEEHLAASSGTVQWTDLDITAAVASFFFGGLETTTTLLCFAVYELTVNPDIQKKLRTEIDDTQRSMEDRKLTYETLQKMQYLDMVVSEALRRWSPAGLLNRKCIKEYTMEDFNGNRVTVERDQVIQFPVKAIHLDPRYYPDPLRFDPERFSKERVRNIRQDAFLPFGSGPRNCIGSRLALMQCKCFLYFLFANFVVELSERTDVPIKLDLRALGMQTKSGFWFQLIPRRDTGDI